MDGFDHRPIEETACTCVVSLTMHIGTFFWRLPVTCLVWTRMSIWPKLVIILARDAYANKPSSMWVCEAEITIYLLVLNV